MKVYKSRHGFEKVLRLLIYAEIIFDELISVYVTQIPPSLALDHALSLLTLETCTDR